MVEYLSAIIEMVDLREEHTNLFTDRFCVECDSRKRFDFSLMNFLWVHTLAL